MIRLVVLVDNKPGDDPALEVEHGLSMYIETAHEKILLDVGASDKFLKNAEKLHVDIADVDYLVLSHAHKDHTGGLECFLNHNSKAKIYLSAAINDHGYFSTRRGLKRDISIDYSLLAQYADRFIPVQGNVELTSDVQIIGTIPSIYAKPLANRTLMAGDAVDSFDHEIALLVKDGEKAVLFSSCTHLGVLNVLEACKGISVSELIGGLHFVDSDERNQFETEADLEAFVSVLHNNYPDLHICTGHCTGPHAMAVLAKLLPDHFDTFYTGYTQLSRAPQL